MTRLAAIACIVALAAACGGSSTDVPTAAPPTATVPAAGTVTPNPTSGPSTASAIVSEDGLATLRIPVGALPEGVTAEDIQIVALDPAVFEEGQEPGVEIIAAFELLPDGLVLNAPATIEFPVGDSGDIGLYLAAHVSGDEVEFPPTELFVQESGEFLMVVTVQHFSDVRAVRVKSAADSNAGALKLTVDGGVEHQVGPWFDVTINSPKFRDFVVKLADGAARFSVADSSPEIDSVKAEYDMSVLHFIQAVPEPTVSLGSTDSPASLDWVGPITFPLDATFSCAKVGETRVVALAFSDVKLNYVYSDISPELAVSSSGTLSVRRTWKGSGPLQCAPLTSATRTPTSSVALPTFTPTPAEDPLVTAIPESVTPTASVPPFVLPIDSNGADFTTYYRVRAIDVDSDKLTYLWSGWDCGTVSGETTKELAWTHTDAAGCSEAHSQSHHSSAKIAVVVSDGTSSVRCEYPYGTVEGSGPNCVLQ